MNDKPTWEPLPSGGAVFRTHHRFFIDHCDLKSLYFKFCPICGTNMGWSTWNGRLYACDDCYAACPIPSPS